MIRKLCAGLLLTLILSPIRLFAFDSSQARILAKGDHDFPPYAFVNKAGRLDGFEIDLLTAIAREMNIDVHIELDTWETVRDELRSGKIHMATGMIRSDQREQNVDFTITHAGVFYCLFVRQGSTIESIDDAHGKEILVHAKAYSHDWLKDHNITDRIVAEASPQEALRLLAQGSHDCAILERLSTLDLLKELRIDTIVMAGPPLVCAPYAFAVKKGDHQLLARLNEGLHRMHQNGDYATLYRKWFSVADAHSRRLILLRRALIVLSAIVGFTVVFFILNRSLKRTVRKRTADLQQSNRRFRELSNLLPQTVFETDQDGRLIFLNRSGFDMLGLSDHSLEHNIHLSAWLPDLPSFNRILRDGGRQGTECVVRGPDIDPFPALLYLSAIASDSGRPGTRGLLVDITFQKELERQIIEAQKLEAMGRLAGGVAHDFGNIITGIFGYVQLIIANPHNRDAVADWADKIHTGCERASDLVRYFLATAGQRQLEKACVQLDQLVAEIFKLLQPSYGTTITFDNAIDPGDDRVWVEPALIFQVLMNLCVNGAQAMAEQGGRLTVGLFDDKAADAPASSGGTTLAPSVTVFVQDTGPGIDPQVKDRIFDPFFSTKGEQKGTGIGLYVASQAIAEMGGTIEVDSVVGKGTTFFVTLPAAC